jgi:membrane protein YqaA with SNARE-associated domain
VTALLGLAMALATGVASALVPLVSAEAYAVLAATRTRPRLAVLVVLALAVGQTAGKLVLFESGRRGAGRFGGRFGGRLADNRWAQRVSGRLRSDRTGVPIVLASAALGLPPLAVVSLACGASGQRLRIFAVVCLVGRTARFAVLVMPIAYGLSR